ncbi:MAG: hypothetical protein HYW52_08050 [Gemmatimonadetes bacterium]|nr:hypothetical protein [Gemmatimonadota bacterium]
MRPKRSESVAGITLAAAAGFGVGLLAGLVAGEWLGDVDADRVRRAVGRLRPAGAPADAAGIERTVRNALEAEAGTRYLKARPRVLGEKINRLLVEGQDIPLP